MPIYFFQNFRASVFLEFRTEDLKKLNGDYAISCISSGVEDYNS